uniref:Uncharacterized protein n=1 Tax=Euplotes crassus TaxID=5936 RepID=A0A7S3NT10_EUPCR
MIEGQPKVNIKTQHAQATPEMLAQADLSNEMLMNSGEYPPTHELQDFSKFSHNETTIDDQYTKLDYYRQYPVEHRTVLWEQNRRKRIEEIKNKNKDNELTGCTFKPNLTSNPNDYMKGSQKIDGKVNISSIDKFLSRMYSARIERENK